MLRLLRVLGRYLHRRLVEHTWYPLYGRNESGRIGITAWRCRVCEERREGWSPR